MGNQETRSFCPGKTIEFVYPPNGQRSKWKQRYETFDRAAYEIVKALEERGWNVPDFDILFDISGSGGKLFRCVHKIKHGDGYMIFERTIGRLLSDLNNHAGLNKICIGNDILSFYDDDSGSLEFEGKKYHMTKNSFTLYDARYDPSTELKIDPIFDYFAAKLNFILAIILTYPVTGINESYFQPKQVPIPFPPEFLSFAQFPPIYYIGDYEKYLKLVADIETLEPEDRYFHRRGKSIMHSRYQFKNADLPSNVNEGFMWCGIGVMPDEINSSYELNESRDTKFPDIDLCPSSMLDYESHLYIFQMVPKWANYIFVMDDQAYTDTREEMISRYPKDKARLTDDENDAPYIARARTLIPILEYKGGYKMPILLIEREVGLDEVKFVHKIPNPYKYKRDRIPPTPVDPAHARIFAAVLNPSSK